MHFLFSILLAAFLTGCASKVVTPTVTLNDPQEAWARVLDTYVDDRGLVNFAALNANPKDLEGYVNYIARVSPETSPKLFPSADSKMAHYLNAYNALSMYNVLLKRIPQDNNTLSKRVRFFYETSFEIGGKRLSLYSYENDLIRKLGDPRVHVALNCMAMSCPRLPRKPFTGDKLQAQLDAQAVEFYNENRNVRVNPATKTVHFSEILDFFTEDFLVKAPSLIAYANQYRKEKIPADYRVDFIPYNWTINNQATSTKGLASHSH